MLLFQVESTGFEHVTILEYISKGSFVLKLSPHVGKNPWNPHMQRNQTIGVHKSSYVSEPLRTPQLSLNVLTFRYIWRSSAKQCKVDVVPFQIRSQKEGYIKRKEQIPAWKEINNNSGVCRRKVFSFSGWMLMSGLNRALAAFSSLTFGWTLRELSYLETWRPSWMFSTSEW